jgi:hypothetical protein
MADRSSLVLSSIIMSLYRMAMIFLISQINNPAATRVSVPKESVSHVVARRNATKQPKTSKKR